MAFEIPIPENERAFELRVELDGDFYGLRIWHNGRANAWFMDVQDGDGNATARAIRLVPGVALTAHLRNLPGVPPGFLVLADTQGRGEEPGENDLGTRHKLIYWTEAELLDDVG